MKKDDGTIDIAWREWHCKIIDEHESAAERPVYVGIVLGSLDSA